MIYVRLFLNFLKIGAFTFGGGYAMLPLISDTVLFYGWISKEEIVNFIAVSESTPGPFAVNMATYIGFETGGILGAFLATMGVILPSFVVIIIIAKFYKAFKENDIVKGCMEGIRPAVLGLIASAFITVFFSVFTISNNMWNMLSKKNVVSIIIIAIASVMAYKKVHPILIIIVNGILGLLAGNWLHL